MRTAQIFELIPALVTLSGRIGDFERPSCSGYRVFIPSAISYPPPPPFLQLFEACSQSRFVCRNARCTAILLVEKRNTGLQAATLYAI